MKKKLLSLLLFSVILTGCSTNDSSLDSSVQIDELNGLTEIEVLHGVGDLTKYSSDITYEELAREPEKNQGQLFTATGIVGQVMEDEGETQYLLILDDDPSHIVYAHFLNDNPNYDGKRILENDLIDFKAASIGMTDYQTSNNTTKTVPNIVLHSYEIVTDSIAEFHNDEKPIIDFNEYKEFQLGQTVGFETGHEVTVHDIFETSEDSNNFINNRYIRVDFSFKNGESEPVTLSGPIVKMYNFDGTEAIMDSNNFLYDEVLPGDTLEKSIYFDAKDSPYRVIFGDSLWISE